VTCLDADRIPASGQDGYATTEDARKLFTDDSNGLYLLSFLLTANHDKAEQCFVADLDDCVDGKAVLQDWADSWVRRAIVRNAIRMIAPHNGQAKPTKSAFRTTGIRGVLKMPVQDVPFASILRLSDFERFVYVLSVLEGCSDQECVVLLGTSRQAVQETRALALQHVSDFERVITEWTTDLSSTAMS
jgi:hypothetical protein